MISSLATYVPPKLVTNADLEKVVEVTDARIRERTGIRERHVVDRGSATSDLAKEAAEKAIERAGLLPDDIGLIIVGTSDAGHDVSEYGVFTSSEDRRQHSWGFDLSAACSAFTYAITTASQMVATGAHDHALVVGADVMSSIIDSRIDRLACCSGMVLGQS